LSDLATTEPAIRIARDHADIQACVELQRGVWGLNDLDVTGPSQLLATVYAGAILLLAEDPEGRVFGFSYAFPGLRGGEPHLHSDMLAVLPEARGRGLGPRLKWAQRDEALRRGLALITWSFDPLQAGNARLNLRRLGATATEILPDLFGTTSSKLYHGLPTDRLAVRWELQSPSVRERSGGQVPLPAARLLDAPRINDVDVENITEEVRPFGAAWDTHKAIGVGRMPVIELGGVYDDTAATGPDALFGGRVPETAATATRTLAITWGSTKITTVETLLLTYRRTADKSGLTKWLARLQPTGAVVEA